jgi:Putative Ig domain/Secretion system C-terminal sorting domain/WD40-like Beta Propeller Repeat
MNKKEIINSELSNFAHRISIFDKHLLFVGFAVFIGMFLTQGQIKAQVTSSAEVRGPYFGQTPPGDTPRLFAPGILTLPGGIVAVTRIAFSPDGNECFFSGPVDWNFSNTRMYHTKCVDSVWTPHELVSFFSGNSCRQPWFSASGDTLYFNSDKNGSSDIWMVVRATEGWGTPQVLPYPINTSSYDGMYTRTKDGTIYIESDRPGGHGNIDIWRISPQNGIQNLGVPVNTSGADNDPFVSPDGKYLIFGSNYNDLFVTFNKGNGSWTAPINLNQFCPGINTSGSQEYAPYITTDGKYLFFNRINNGEFYWVSTHNFDSLRNINFPPYLKNLIPNQTTKKGSLFNYQVPDSTFIDDNGNNTLSYTASLSNGNPLPSWLNFNPNTKTFSGTPDTAGIFKIKVMATDTAKASVSAQFTLTIKNISTSIYQIKGQKISIFPNPTSGLVSIYFGAIQQQAFVEIFNITGKSILTQTIQNISNTTIDLSGCPKGMYLLNLTVENEIFNEKIYLQ